MVFHMKIYLDYRALLQNYLWNKHEDLILSILHCNTITMYLCIALISTGNICCQIPDMLSTHFERAYTIHLYLY